MTNTELGETFPAGTAAHRIEQSIRTLTAGFRYRLLELEGHSDLAVAEQAMAAVNRISQAQHELFLAMQHVAPLLTRMGEQVEGRDIEEEDRAVLELLQGLQDLAGNLKERAGESLADALTSWAAVRAFRGRGGRR